MCRFGTPVALAAPILQTFGFDPIPTACLCLAMNSLETTFGAVGTPFFFGFSQLVLDDGTVGVISDDLLLTTALKVQPKNMKINYIVHVG